MRDVPWEEIIKLSASAAVSEFCDWVQVGMDVYILHCKYQVKPYSLPLFSAACAAAKVHRNHLFCLYQQNKSSESKVKFRQASNHCMKLPNLHMLLKQKSPSLPRKLVLGTFGELLIVLLILSKGKSAIPPLFKGLVVLSSPSDQAKLFTKNFSKNANLDDSGISLPAFPSRTNLELHDISVTPTMV